MCSLFGKNDNDSHELAAERSRSSLLQAAKVPFQACRVNALTVVLCVAGKELRLLVATVREAALVIFWILFAPVCKYVKS